MIYLADLWPVYDPVMLCSRRFTVSGYGCEVCHENQSRLSDEVQSAARKASVLFVYRQYYYLFMMKMERVIRSVV